MLWTKFLKMLLIFIHKYGGGLSYSAMLSWPTSTLACAQLKGLLVKFPLYPVGSSQRKHESRRGEGEYRGSLETNTCGINKKDLSRPFFNPMGIGPCQWLPPPASLQDDPTWSSGNFPNKNLMAKNTNPMRYASNIWWSFGFSEE